MIRRIVLARERGSSLILVLIMIAVIGAVMGVVLDQADTTQRATVNLRDQAAANYGSDAAAQAALNLLTSATSETSDWCATSGTKTIGTTSSPFYPAANGNGSQAMNAYATCSSDPHYSVSPSPTSTSSLSVTQPPPVVTTSGNALGVGGDGTTPAYALFTTGTGSTDFGIDITQGAANKNVCIEDGSVYSAKDIYVGSETLQLQMDTAHGGNSLCTGAHTWTDTSTSPASIYTLAIESADKTTNGCLVSSGSTAANYTPTPCTNKAASQATPNEDLTQASMTTIPLPPIATISPSIVCPKTSGSGSSTWAALTPGYYDSTWLTKLNNLSTTCTSANGQSTTINNLWLSPGAYYFDLGGTWNWPMNLVAGTPINGSSPISGLSLTPTTKNNTLANLSTIPASLQNARACLDPDADSASVTASTGATLVFAGATKVSVGSNASEVCASKASGSAPPVAIWGLGYPDETVHSVSVPVQGGGTRSVPTETLCTSSGCGGATSGTTLFATDSDGQADYFVRGFFYAPNAQLIMNLKNSLGQVFYWGVVARNLSIGVNGSSPAQPFAKLPQPSNGIAPVVTTSTPPPVTSTVTYSTAGPAQPTIRYLNIYTCPASVTTCNASSGALAVRAKVAWTPPAQVGTINGAGTLRILSWTNVN